MCRAYSPSVQPEGGEGASEAMRRGAEGGVEQNHDQANRNQILGLPGW